MNRRDKEKFILFNSKKSFPKPILDDISGASVAFSLRTLKTGHEYGVRVSKNFRHK